MTSVGMTLRAAVRLSPRQFRYHLKRAMRNKIARRFPSAYASHIERRARSLPVLASTAPAAAAIDMAKSIAPFYHDEYVASIDDAADGRFSFFGQTADFRSPETIDWHFTVAAESDFHLWRMKLGHMGFVCPMLISGGKRHHDAVSAMLASYRRSANFSTPGCFTSYWFPYSVSHRILAILSGYVLSYSSLDEQLRADIESFLTWNAGFVVANIEHELKNNHVERNLAALCLYYTCAESVPTGVASRLDREVKRIIDACVLADGFISERSAMYQGLTVMALDVFAKTPFLAEATREFATAMHKKALQAWATMTHPDGEIALFNDSWFGEVPPVSHIVTDDTLTPVSLLPEAGYVRLESDGVFVLMDAGPIGPRWNPGHGHADFLAVEADVAGRRFIVDPGTFQYSTGSRRTFERSAGSHNGPHRRGLEPVEYMGCFRVGRVSEARLGAAESNENATGHLSLPDGSEVSRMVSVAPGIVRFTDTWSDASDAQVSITVAGEWVPVSRSKSVVEFRLGDTYAAIAVVEGGISSVETGEWAHHYLESDPATVLVLEPLSEHVGAQLVWEIRKQENK